MNLYALGNNRKTIYAGHAERHVNYTCLECNQIVRLRSGLHRQPHFYHLQPNQKCRLNGKSMTHLMIQDYLKSILPKGEIHLEYRFPAINRIADVAWLSEKIIFEVQCSPISAAEILERNSDYSSQGYQVVWILHQNRYNQIRVTAAENILQSYPHYFSDMDSSGKGEIYDQLSFIIQGIRKQKMPRMTINMMHPLRYFNFDQQLLPEIIKYRLKKWPVYFLRDYINLCHKDEGGNLIDKILEAESKWMLHSENDFLELSLYAFLKKIFTRLILIPYRSLLRILLEKSSS